MFGDSWPAVWCQRMTKVGLNYDLAAHDHDRVHAIMTSDFTFFSQLADMPGKPLDAPCSATPPPRAPVLQAQTH
jgi:hypothetical protein